MLTLINRQGVKSTDGFIFQFTGRFTAEYRENGDILKLYVGGNSNTVDIYDQKIKTFAFKNSRTSGKEYENKIKENIREAILYFDMNVNFISGTEPV